MSIRIHALMHLLTYLLTNIVGSGRIKPAISRKRLNIERKLLLTVYIKSNTGFRLPSKCMALNDLCAIFRVIDSLNAAKMAKYSLVMTPTPCRMAGYIICVKKSMHALVHLLTYLPTQLARAYKAGNIYETVEDRAKATILTAYIKSYTGFRLPPKCMTLDDL